jgi:hypothetical protein
MTDEKTGKDAPHIPGPAPGTRGPATGLHSPADRGAKPTDDKAAEQNREAAARAGEQQQPTFTPEQLATPRADAADTRQMYIIVGPYRGQVLTMPNDEAESAKDNHWAVEMSEVSPPYDASQPREHDHELTDEDRAHAIESANEWAANVNAPPEPPPPEGETEAQRREREAKRREPALGERHGERHEGRDVGAGRPGEYETRDTAGKPTPRR